MRIRARLVHLLIFLAVIFLTVFIIQKRYEQQRLIQLLGSVQAEREYVFDKIASLQQKPLQTFAYDYSFWDEMVNFVNAPNKKWAVENIEFSLNTYQANAVWVYNLDNRLVYSVHNIDGEAGLMEMPVPPSAISSLFAGTPFCHFFAETPKGLMEIYGAAIQSSVDVKREGPAVGYLFCGRLWIKEYINELSQLTGSAVALVDSVKSQVYPAASKGRINFSRALFGWDNQPVKYLVVSATSVAITSARKLAVQVAILFLSFFMVILIIVSIFIYYWISIPLKLITLSLEKGNSVFLNKMKKQSTEFGDISRMVDSFFIQRKTILEEISERKRTQEALSKVNSCFVSFGTEPDRNIQLITETAGQILDATCMLYNRNHDGILVTKASWNEPADFSRSDLGQGHICFDVINAQDSQPVILEDLQHTSYAHTDPNVKKYNLQSYVSCPVQLKGRTVASLCAVFTSSVRVSEYYLNLLQVLGKAASIEEDRKHTEEIFKAQALELDNALKEALKSREVLLSMLEDNQLNKIKLEQSVQELADAYSKLKESQEEVIQAEKFGAIGQLASSVAHEVRNPLAIIMQSIEYLGNRVPAEHRDIIEVAANSIRRANTIVGTLLDFSKAKKLSMGLEDVNSILEDALTLTNYSNLKNQIQVVKELGSELPKVSVDRQKIEQVFVNIILNAMQSMPGAGHLFVRSYLIKFNNLKEEIKNKIQGPALSMGNFLTIEVEDEGVGIPEENLQNIFRPFFTTKGAMTGIGLGLSVVKDIIALHNGYVGIESRVNKGTKVTIVLKAD
ncbi:MAG: CHASE4 domain-containing protein [Candidatus Omnitrophica bacterium]|nr:CHASE4 domain-containing protein [Candidatus Omnitrophota bacterium]